MRTHWTLLRAVTQPAIRTRTVRKALGPRRHPLDRARPRARQASFGNGLQIVGRSAVVRVEQLRNVRGTPASERGRFRASPDNVSAFDRSFCLDAYDVAFEIRTVPLPEK
jgi:hypothetical protein